MTVDIPLLTKGALVEFSPTLGLPIPKIISFQYNPMKISRQFNLGRKHQGEDKENTPHCVAQHEPKETFNLSLVIDATDSMDLGNPISRYTGVADRLAALELLIHPPHESILLGAVTDLLNISTAEPEENPLVPIVLFVWGLGKVLPVRIKSFSIEEQAFAGTLYPTRAQVNLGMLLLAEEDLEVYPKDHFGKEIAIACAKYNKEQKLVLSALRTVSGAVDFALDLAN